METNLKRKWLALSLWDKIGPRGFAEILESSVNIHDLLDDLTLLNLIFTGPKNPGKPPMETLLSKADKLLELEARKRFRILTILESQYPTPLKHIHTPPPVLFCQGDINILRHPSIAVVGTRKPTSYGIESTRKFTAELVQNKFVIVSGMAMGIDAIAHQTVLDHNGYTVAVLGCGLDNPYPKTNTRIRKQVEKTGCVVTEFPWGTPPNPAQFPRRNRIISGLSSAVLIIECTLKSGALITVKHAVDQNRTVFALPGPVTSVNSHGPIRVIQQGGTPVLFVDDILSHYKVQPDIPFPPPFVDEDELKISDDLRPLWDLLDVTPISVDDLISALQWSPSEVQSALLKMELLGLVKQLPGPGYIRALSPVSPTE